VGKVEEADQSWPQMIGLLPFRLCQVADVEQGIQEAVHGAAGKAGPAHDLGQREAGPAGRDDLQDQGVPGQDPTRIVPFVSWQRNVPDSENSFRLSSLLHAGHVAQGPTSRAATTMPVTDHGASDFPQRSEWVRARNRARDQQDISATANDLNSYQ
jgi:hypothetical protein